MLVLGFDLGCFRELVCFIWFNCLLDWKVDGVGYFNALILGVVIMYFEWGCAHYGFV